METAINPSSRYRIFIVVALLSLLLHLFLVMFWEKYGANWLTPAPPRVEVETVDPAKLESIRKQWKRQQQLLMSKPNAPHAATPPKDARYFSDHNTQVEREQRARVTQPLPKAGSAAVPAHPAAPVPAHPAVPSLGQLGLPLKLTAKPEARPQPETRPASPATQGGDQALQEDQLPEGSENMLNTQESVYYSFYARLFEAVVPLWQSYVNEAAFPKQIQPAQYTTLADIVLDRNGTLLYVRIVHDSGLVPFDSAVTAAWKHVGRFPNPPTGLLDGQGQVHVLSSFIVNVGVGSRFQLLPPERVE